MSILILLLPYTNMKCPICGKRLAEGDEVCQSCENAMGSKRENLTEIVGRHREWAINRLLCIDGRLGFLKAKVKELEINIKKFEREKFALFKRLRFSCKTSGGKK